jgi:predicted aldo/keto reductase-like oxidoreductase
MARRSNPLLFTRFSRGPVADRPPLHLCRFGLANRGDGGLTAADIGLALERGVNFLNWCGSSNSLRDVIATLGPRRRELAVCVQFEARTGLEAEGELRRILQALNTDYVDVLTFYYVEEPAEWQQIAGPGGALEYCRKAQQTGQVGLLGLTTHQRPLARDVARTGLLDLLMIRYNAAHRGAETDVFPTMEELGLPVVAYTCLRWGALLQGTPDDPAGFQVPRATAWYRFVLQSPSVTIALMAPENRSELEEDLTVLDAAGLLSRAEYEELARHGERVRRHAGRFP